MKTERDKLLAPLARRLLWWRAGLCARDVMQLLQFAVLTLLVFVALDFIFALPRATRVVLDALALAFFGGLAVSRLATVLRLSGRQAAERMDALAGDRRRSVLAAWELLAASTASKEGSANELHRFLIERAVARGCDVLAKVPAIRALPVPELKQAGRVLVLVLVLAGAALGIPHQASRILLARVLTPNRDVPPLSPYTFTISPSPVTVLYGGAAEISVTIDGAPVTSQVFLVTRAADGDHQTACFQENGNRFAQRLEKVSTEVEFCFRTGRARSRWQRVELRLQPQIAVARLSLQPPAYSGLPKHEFVIGEEPIQCLAGTKAELRVTSNRPLSGGVMTIASPDGETVEDVVAERTGAHTVSLSWTVRETANLAVVLRDILGTRSAAPLSLRQTVLEDAVPTAVLTHPPAFAMATPRCILPLSGYAEDDLGLSRVELVRAMVGYRDRSLRVDRDQTGKQVMLAENLDLAQIGLEPGEVLEFYLEARDRNPALTGVGSSDIVRVQIIAEEDYVQSMRNQTTLEQFMARYRTAAKALEEFRKTLSEIKAAREAGDTARVKELLRKAQEQAKETAALFEKMAEDLELYDVEKELTQALRDTFADMHRAGQLLARTSAEDPNLDQTLAQILERLKGNEETIHSEQMRAEDAARVGRVMMCAGVFQRLVKRQEELTIRLRRFRDGGKGDNALLAALGSEEEAIRKDLLAFLSALRDRARELPDAFSELRRSAEEFADRLEALEVPPLMQKSVDAAGSHDGPNAHRFAAVALERMLQLLSDSCEGFGGLCQGQLTFKVPKDLSGTLNQMLSAMLSQGYGGGGWGVGTAGLAGNGSAASGAAMAGSARSVPMYGPPRNPYAGEGMAGKEADADAGRGTGGAALIGRARETLDVPREERPHGEASQPVRIPSKYRDAVKRYFTEEN